MAVHEFQQILQSERCIFIKYLILQELFTCRDIADLVRPAPAALCYEAPLPQAQAQMFARIISEQKGRYATPSAPATANVCSELKTKMQKLLRSGGETFAINYDPSAEYTVERPNYKLMNSSRGKERIKRTGISTLKSRWDLFSMRIITI